MSKKKLLINLIKKKKKTEFDIIVKTYLKEIYGFSKIINTDGKDDIGLDIKVFNVSGKDIQYQLTTQKSATKPEKAQFDKKIKEDLEKAKLNTGQYGYSNKLFFFYSMKLTNKTIREYQRIALTDFGIDLEIIEANRIAEESEDFIELQRAIYKLNDFESLNDSTGIFEDENKNLVMDLIGFGKSSEIRKQIVESFILQLLFKRKRMLKSEIIKESIDK